jgi:hypothetical protein
MDHWGPRRGSASSWKAVDNAFRDTTGAGQFDATVRGRAPSAAVNPTSYLSTTRPCRTRGRVPGDQGRQCDVLPEWRAQARAACFRTSRVAPASSVSFPGSGNQPVYIHDRRRRRGQTVIHRSSSGRVATARRTWIDAGLQHGHGKPLFRSLAANDSGSHPRRRPGAGQPPPSSGSERGRQEAYASSAARLPSNYGSTGRPP